MPQSEGYLLVDHRASPGLTEQEARLLGYEPALTREGKVYEAGSLTCCHCKTVAVKNPFRQRPRESCPKCRNVRGDRKYLCDFCYADTFRADYSHDPWDKKVDAVVNAMAKRTLGSPTKLLMP